MKKCITTLKVNVKKEMQTWAKLAKDAKAQAKHAQKKFKSNTPLIEVTKEKGKKQNQWIS